MKPVERYTVPCRAPLWARGGHAQTVMSHLIPSRGARIATPGWDRRELQLDDGDRLALFTRPGVSGVRVHLFHGLAGDANADYMRRTAVVLGAQGHELWAVNHRGCGAGRGLARQPYHSGKTVDVQAVLAASRREAPDRLHIVIGFSLSGNIALLHDVEGREPRPDAVIAVNPPVDLLNATRKMDRGLNRLYQLRFILRLRRAVQERERRGLTTRHYEIPWRATMFEFDDMFTAPECGFESGLDYYLKASTVNHLAAISTPTVILTSADDPFVDASVFDRVGLSPSVFLHVEPRGGHVGYLARRGVLLWGRWLEGALLHYVTELVGLSKAATS